MPAQVARRIADWMRACQAGRIVDSVHRRPGTYADGFAALVFWLLDWREPAQQALQVSRARPLESEFDALAQALMGCRPARFYDGSALVSRNWQLFRCLTRSLCGLDADYQEIVQHQLPCGLFPDSPYGQATPTCYHAKMCATLLLAQQLAGVSGLETHWRPGLDALAALVSPEGILVPYGRSRNSLFGYASAYLALRLGAYLDNQPEWAWAAERVLERLRSHQQPDGHIPAVLNDSEWIRGDWDVYLNNPDYNAYAAACLLLADRLAPTQPVPQAPGPALLSLGPLLVCRRPQDYFACSTHGEWAPLGTPFFSDTRYAGLVPLLWNGRVWDENYCWDGRNGTRGVLGKAAVSGWIPGRHWVRTFPAWEHHYAADRLVVQGRGRPYWGRPAPAWWRRLRAHSPQWLGVHAPWKVLVRLEVDFAGRRLRLLRGNRLFREEQL